MLSGMMRSMSVESFCENPEGSGGSGFSVRQRLTKGVRRQLNLDKDAQMHMKYVMKDQVERPQFLKKIVLAYVICAALIAVLCITGQVIVQVYELRTHTDGRYVNIAGKQRYYSQAISNAAYALERFNASGDAALSARFQANLQSSLQDWYTHQNALLHGDNSLDIPGSKDRTVRKLFAQTNPSFQTIYGAGAGILHQVSGQSFAALQITPPQNENSNSGISQQVDIIAANVDEFIFYMDQIVKRFQDIGEQHMTTLLIITWIFCGLILLTLVLEGFFLVRPVLTKMHLLVAERFDLLRASLEAEAGARGISILMVGYVGHEMREPLGSVMRNLRYLFGQLKQMAAIYGKPEGGALHEACKSAMETVRQSQSSCRLLSTVVDDIADMRKLEAGMLSLCAMPVDVGGCVRHAAGMMQPKLGVTLRQEIDPAVEKKKFNLDRHRLEQLLVNLISNALKFTREGSVLVRVLPWDARGLRFEVIDTGEGLTPDASAKVFMPFIETPEDKLNFQGGTGLGLYICKLLADVMGGTIGVTSEVGKGSTFWFNLPATAVFNEASSSEPQGAWETSTEDGFTATGALPERAEEEIDEDERELPPLMDSPKDAETTVSGPGHVHHGGVAMSAILGGAKSLEDVHSLSPRGSRSLRGGSLKGGSLFLTLPESASRKGGSFHGANSYKGEGSHRGGARRGASLHGGNLYRGENNHYRGETELGGSLRGSTRGAPSPLGNGLVRSLSATPLLEKENSFVYHGRVIKRESEAVSIEMGGSDAKAPRIGRESARGGTLFLQLQEKLKGGANGVANGTPRDASDMV